jgi:4-amino-4-deoxy-L-arabinose transferase-like glycosyltransferase
LNTARRTTLAGIRRHLPALGIILIPAAATRIVWLRFVFPDPNDGRFDDTVWYRNAAHYIAHGQGYLNPFAGTPTAMWPPGYPAFLAGVFKLAGEGLTQTYAANVALAMITAAIVYAIGLALFDRRTALIGAVAVAVWPGQVYFASLALSEELFTALFTLALLLMLLAARASTWRGPLVMLTAAVVTAAALTRGQALLLLAVLPVALALSGVSWRRAIGWGILAAAVTGALLAPWVARNQRELGSPVLIATNLGGNLWLGNHAGATGRMQSAQPLPLPSREGITEQEYEVTGDRMDLRKALAYMRSHPLDEVRLAALKLRAMYESDATALDWNSGYDDAYYAGNSAAWLRALANGFWFAAISFAGAGLIAERWRLRGMVALLPITLLAWTGLHLVFFGDPRFHYPVVFIVALLGARGLIAVYETVLRRQPSLRRRYAAA